MLKKHNSLTNKLNTIWARTTAVSRPFSLLPLFWLLCFFEFFYKISFKVTRFFRGLWKPYQSRFPVIGIGNLVVGGVGKTVAVELIVGMLKNYHPAIIVSGYGGVDADDPGDEARMLAHSLSVPIMVAQSRARGVQIIEDACDEEDAEDKLHVGVVVLDDAYQHQTLKKDIEVLIIDARAPFDNGHLLPAGRLREKDTSRANLFIFTHVASRQMYEDARAQIKAPDEQCFAFRHTLTHLHNFSDEKFPLEAVRGKNIFAVAALGDTQQFFDMLRNTLDVYIEQDFSFVDHYAYKQRDIEYIAEQAEAAGIEYIITTAKDWPKIKPLLDSLPQSRHVWRVALVTLDGLTYNEHTRLSAHLTAFLERHSAA